LNPMQKSADAAMRWYTAIVTKHPVMVIIILTLLIGVLGYQARNFRIDASAETLLLEHDKDLRYTREISRRYGVTDFLLIAYTPKNGDLFAPATLEDLRRLRDAVAALERVDSVVTILDVPLLESPPISYKDISEGLPTIESPAVDKELAKTEFSQSPFYRDLLVSRDLTTTALVVNLKSDDVYRQLIDTRNAYLDTQLDRVLTPEENAGYRKVVDKIRRHLEVSSAADHENIMAIRAIMENHRAAADLFLGGISMIADDMIAFIKRDLKTFGAGVFVLLVAMLGIIFKGFRWIALPMLCCAFAVIVMVGLLGTFGWDVTVISSNFISLQLIITLAIVVHLIVRYREYQQAEPSSDQYTLVEKSVRQMFVPCLYAVLTTMAGFASLLLCDIKPVIHFGLMMSAGIVVSLIITFLLFPAFLMLLPKKETSFGVKHTNFSLPVILARFTQNHGILIIVATIVLSVLTIIGISKLVVENSFIDYFKESTEIYQGMSVLDQKLGGTTPVDVIVRFEPIMLDEEEGELAEDDLEKDPFAEFVNHDTNQYWFTDHRLSVVEKVHDYLEEQPETGKVLSLGTLLKIGRDLNSGKSLDSLDMAVFYKKLPDDFKKLILNPYLSIPDNEVRFSVRVKDSMKSLKRDAFLKRIKHELVDTLGLPKDKVHLAGTMVLYNNMLQSLFASQIKTLGVVALALLVMFWILFRSLKISLIALFPNLFSSGAVLGVMGWMHIPLDMMTITIAAISIGIAVDDTIHYIHRFQSEIKKDRDYLQTMHRCHGSIGHAMFYTSIVIIIGFSILVFSNFWPTIYFGLFTGLAMLIAMVAALTLLPKLILMFKPFGPEGGKAV
jgi:predicted RND superfamily exporter protein